VQCHSIANENAGTANHQAYCLDDVGHQWSQVHLGYSVSSTDIRASYSTPLTLSNAMHYFVSRLTVALLKLLLKAGELLLPSTRALFFILCFRSRVSTRHPFCLAVFLYSRTTRLVYPLPMTSFRLEWSTMSFPFSKIGSKYLPDAIRMVINLITPSSLSRGQYSRFRVPVPYVTRTSEN
jgi:hypothetical protein